MSPPKDSPLKDSPGMRLACDECHVRKLRCSRNTTACTRCIRNGIECLYSPARKVGRRSKAERLASSDAAGYRNGQRMQTLKSMGSDEAARFSPPAPEEDRVLATLWEELGGDGFDQLPWQGPWSLPLSAGQAGFGDGDGGGQYDPIAMADIFANEDLWGNQSLSTQPSYSQIPSRFEPTPSPKSPSDRMEPATFLTSSPQSSGSNEGASSEAIYSNIQRLSKLQQDLFVHRTRMSDRAAEGCPREVVDIDAVIGVGQAILELTRSLFACFTTAEPLAGNGRRDGRDDPARILLALTPSLLVVTTYNDILDLISRALHEMKHIPPSRNTQLSGSAFFTPTMAHDSPPRPPRGQPRYHGGLFGKTLQVGKLDLDFPVRLILSMTVMEYQLGPLYRSLQLIRSKPLPRPGIEGIDSSRDMLAPSIEGLWLATQGLRERVVKLIEQAKLVDKH